MNWPRDIAIVLAAVVAICGLAMLAWVILVVAAGASIGGNK